MNAKLRAFLRAMVFAASLALGIATTISSGGGGLGSLDNPFVPADIPPPAEIAPGGIWIGTSNSQGETTFIEGVITEDRQGRFVDENGTQFVVRRIYGENTLITIEFDAYAQFGYEFLDGSTIGTGTISGVINVRSDISGNYSFSTGESGTISMTYDSLYDRDSSLDKLSGSWDEGTGIMTVDPNGSFFEQNEFGCVYNGQVSIIDPMYNAYNLSMTVSNCAPDDGEYVGIGVLADFAEDGDEDLFIVQMNSNELIFTTGLVRL